MDHRVKDMGVSPQQGRMIAYIAQNEDKGLIQKDLTPRSKYHQYAARLGEKRLYRTANPGR